MGCVASRIHEKEKVQICRERKRLIKQLLVFRGEFADAQLAYLRALRNTGVTLRQFTESNSLELEYAPFNLAVRPPPLPRLPPAPPPPPPFSPDLRKYVEDGEATQVEIIMTGEDKSCTPPPPPISSSSLDFWDPFGSSSSPVLSKKIEKVMDQVEEENWEETKSEFEEEDQEEEEELVGSSFLNGLSEKLTIGEVVDDNSSIVSLDTKDTADIHVISGRREKTLSGIVKELDDYFLKASGGGEEIAVLMDINGEFQPNLKENKRMRGNSGKVFSALSWSWSSKALHSSRDAGGCCGPVGLCNPGAHSFMLEKVYNDEQRLYMEVKDEESTRLEYERKSWLLLKQEDGNQDWNKTEKTRLTVESLHSDLTHLQQSISRTCSSLLRVVEEELQPQLIAITSGLLHTWRTMYESHQVQNHISHQLNLLSSYESIDPTTEYHRQATAQLETEVTSWYSSFGRLIKSQGDYVRTLCRWAELTACLVDDHQNECSSIVCTLCKKWQHALDRLPDKVVCEAIKGLLSAVQSIKLQQEEEINLHQKYNKLEKKYQKELNLLAETEKKFKGSAFPINALSELSPRHRLSIKRVRTEALKKAVEDEKAKYMNSVRVTQAMSLKNLQTSLPTLFQALMGFSRTCTEAFESIHGLAEPAALL